MFVPWSKYPGVILFPKLWIMGQKEFFQLPYLEERLSWIDEYFNKKYEKFIKNLITISPYHKKLEEEADRIALQLMARACYDVREAPRFWKNHYDPEIVNKPIDKNKPINFFSKHHLDEERVTYLDKYMNAYIKLRESCKCTPLV